MFFVIGKLKNNLVSATEFGTLKISRLSVQLPHSSLNTTSKVFILIECLPLIRKLVCDPWSTIPWLIKSRQTLLGIAGQPRLECQGQQQLP